MGIFSMTYNMGPLGALQAGAVASLFSVPIAVGMGGAAIIALAVGVGVAGSEVRRLERDGEIAGSTERVEPVEARSSA